MYVTDVRYPFVTSNLLIIIIIERKEDEINVLFDVCLRLQIKKKSSKRANRSKELELRQSEMNII